MTLYTGFQYVTKEKIIDLGSVEVTADEQHGMHWSPVVGIVVMIIGGVMLAVGSKKSLT
jgi:hypothetical protein